MVRGYHTIFVRTYNIKMLTLDLLRTQPDHVKERLAHKRFANPGIVDTILELDKQCREKKTAADLLLAERNQSSKTIGELMKSGKKDEAEALKARINDLKDALAALENAYNEHDAAIFNHLVTLPNLPHSSVPAGAGADENEQIYAVKELPQLPTTALPHWELAKKYDIIDFELGTKITGPGFPVYKGKGAVFQRALINFFLDEAIAAGYQEVLPPHLVNEDSAFATGQLPDKEGQMYHATVDNLYLIPTAEVPITNIYRDVILKESELPAKNAGYTPCFRREAGSYGKDVRGLNRLHQFDKVEIVRIEHPDNSYAALEEMVKHVEGLLKKLELPYRILRLCGGDMSFASALTYDFEVYSAAQQRWLEVSSVSNFETFQSNRLKLRFKDSEGKNRLAHTLNGSALALARIVAALLENNQDISGIRVPKALQGYTKFDRIA